MAEIARALILAGLSLAVAACQTLPVARPGVPAPAPAATGAGQAEQADPVASAPSVSAIVATAPDESAPEPEPETSAPAPEPPADLWHAMRSGMTLHGCDYTPGIERWARRYAGSPRRFAAVLDELLPALDYVHRAVQAKGLPSEFALLPIVESHYRPHVAPLNRPAGPWQMIGPTARSGGVVIDAWIDGRLNLAASTDAALVLLDLYGDYFDGDWRLVAFAYNAGEHRVRRALQRHSPGADFDSLHGLGLAAGSYDYLVKLLALACLVREPDRFDLDLPTLEHERRLHRVELEGTVGVSLARALSGLDQAGFDRVNGGLKRERTPPGSGHALLVAGDPAQAGTADLLARIPPARRVHWQRRALAGADTVAGIADRHGLNSSVLLALNSLPPDAVPQPGDRLWLPAEADGALEQVSQGEADGIHVVRSGDSLWQIGRRYGLTVSELLRYNRLDSPRLTPGQRLRLSAP